MMMRNPYKIVRLKDGRYAVQYKDYPHIGILIHTEGSWEKPTSKYCRECGAKMGGTE